MTTPNFSTPLVDLGDVKDHLHITGNDLDSELNGFIGAASAYIQNLTGPITPQTFTETHSGGGHVIFLFHPPVLSVTSVVEYIAATGYTLTQVALGDPTGSYAFSLDDPRSGAIRRRYNGGLVGAFAGGDHNIAVTYVGGQAALPADIRMAVLLDIEGLYRPSQLNTNPYFQPGAEQAPSAKPITMFPRVTEILSAASMRTPALG